jgi:hypothetical protein
MADDDEFAAEADPARGEMSEAEIDRNLAASFPASDPPSWTLGIDHREDARVEPRGVAEDDEAE